MVMKLYPYQVEGVRRMHGEPYFLLGDDMGLGKTVQAIAEIEPGERVLIVCPNSVKGVWYSHLERMIPDMPVLVIGGRNKADVARFQDGALIVNWEALRLIDVEKIVWDRVIADEAHNIKNRKAKRTRALKRIKKVYHKRALTGTPIINRPDELWSILNWLDPPSWRSYWKFFDRYVKSVDSGYGYRIVIGSQNEDELWNIIEPFTVRRLKSEVLKELPDKYYSYLPITMSELQAKAYQEMKRDSLAWLEQLPHDQPLAAPVVLAQLTRLRQFASAYCEVTEDRVRMSEPSTKLDALEEIVSNASGPVVVFSQFRQLIDLAAIRLSRYSVAVLTGKTPTGDRAKLIADFQDGQYDVFATTIQAGGTGITLTRSSTCVFLDRAWSPAMNMQAEDRLHRIGQDNAVQVIVLQSVGTVDFAIERKLEWKRNMIQLIIG